jgi:hypothetical protein
MKAPLPEFSRVLKVDRVPKLGSTEKIAADPSELQALARRLDVPVIHSLSATLRATPWRGGGLKLEGELVADIDQVSVVSLEAFRSQQRFPVLRYFLPGGGATGEEEDADPIIAGHIDMGETVAETLALELDPYPRMPGEEAALPAPVEEPDDTPASPFAALKNLDKNPR